ICFVEAFLFEQYYRQGIAHCQSRRSTGRWCQTQRTGLVFDSDVQDNVTRFGKRRLWIAGHHDQLKTMKLEMRQHLEDLVGFTAVGKSENYISRHYHSELAVHAVTRVNEKGRGTGAGQRGRDLAADQSRFADSGHNNLAATASQHFDGSNENFVESIDHRENTIGLDST